ncbi:hypothetical protein [Saccharopolyspora sp. NPDC002686]|uniref:hypothetical protein n=1 Tax=Saccharopolyspora sp. NPDC002686 TaxID=3154541 RepID=UPI0033325E58
MADQHESPEAGSNLPDKSRPADVVDAEVVESEVVAAPDPQPAGPSQPIDDEQFRQFQQFQKFQEFQRWQEAQGGGDVAVPPTGAKPAEKPEKPWWKKALGLLRFKFVRRLIYLLVLLLLLNYAYDYYFGSSNSSEPVNPGQPPVRPVPRKAPTPEYALFDVYNFLRGDDPALACGSFDSAGANGFAVANQAPDCATAAQKVHDQITDGNAYANPKIGYDAIDMTGREAVVHGCRIQAKGGPQLGSFKLTQQQDGGWAISAYSLHTATCP